MELLSKTFVGSFTIISLFFFSNLVKPAESFAPMVRSLSNSMTETPTSTPPPFKTFMPFDDLSQHESVAHFSEKASYLGDELGKNVVLSVSAGLPKFDTVGHKILSANHDFIYTILHNDNLTHSMKKDIILLSIKLAQMGDDIGSQILEQYYNLVKFCL